VNTWHLQCLRVFEKMHNKFEAFLATTNPKQRLAAGTDYVVKEVHDEFTYAYVNHVSSSVTAASGARDANNQIKRDFSLMICFDHRVNNDFN